MGAGNSHELLEMDEDASTPVKPAAPIRTVEPALDPRSPSSDITRTPIQVELTPADPIVDPRSPTIGITRTPIYTAEEEKSGVSSIAAPSPLLVDTTPVLPRACSVLPPDSEEWGCDTADSPLMNRSASEPDLSPTRQEEEEEVLLLTNNVQARLSFGEANPTKPRLRETSRILFPSKEEPAIPSSRKPPQQPRQLLKSSSEHQRSPLSTRNVDMNSPLAIVQRKQATKLGLLKPASGTHVKRINSPKKYTVFEDDKENMGSQ